ncbi:MAG: cysteine hydrolase family protein [Planctomycetota bacterium]
MRPAFLDVDTQLDFVDPSGKLYARGAEAIKPNLARLVALARSASVPLIASVDAHDESDPEFGQFPPHCLRGTEGQKKLRETTTGREVFVPSKKADRLPDPRSEHVVLEKQVFPVFGNENADAIFDRASADTFFVFGVVTEVCVKAAVLGLLERGYAVKLVHDAIWPIDEKTGEAAKKEMVARGAQLVATQDVIRALGAAKKA